MMYRLRSTGAGRDDAFPNESTGAHASSAIASTTVTASTHPRCLVITTPPAGPLPTARRTRTRLTHFAPFEGAVRDPPLLSAAARGARDVGQSEDARRVQRGDGSRRRHRRLRVLVERLREPRHRTSESRPRRHRRARPGAGVVAAGEVGLP